MVVPFPKDLMISKLREILEVLARHPAAPAPSDLSFPVVWADAEGDTWRLWLNPGYDAPPLDDEDRELCWAEFGSAVSDVVALRLPDGVQVHVTPPFTFPDQKTVNGHVDFVHPPPDMPAHTEAWWQTLCGTLPEVSTLMSGRLVRRWPDHLAAKRERQVGRKEPQYMKTARRLAAQADAVAAARERNKRTGGIKM
jgi:hypothetical protein